MSTASFTLQAGSPIATVPVAFERCECISFIRRPSQKCDRRCLLVVVFVLFLVLLVGVVVVIV